MICRRCGKEQDLASGFIDYTVNSANGNLKWSCATVCIDC